MNNVQLKFDFNGITIVDDEHHGWTDNAIMLDCGDQSLENEIEDSAVEFSDLYSGVELVEYLADYHNVYKANRVIPNSFREIVRKALEGQDGR